MWCLGRVCRPRCWFVSGKSTCVPNSTFNLVLLNNLWIQDIKKSLWWQIPALKYILARSSSPLAANNIFLDLLLVFVVVRITHVALPRELIEKLSFIKSRLIPILHQYFTDSLYVYAGETIMPPRPKPCGGKNFFLMSKVTCKFFNIIIKLKIALYASKIGVTSLHFAFIYEKLDN